MGFRGQAEFARRVRLSINAIAGGLSVKHISRPTHLNQNPSSRTRFVRCAASISQLKNLIGRARSEIYVQPIANHARVSGLTRTFFAGLKSIQMKNSGTGAGNSERRWNGTSKNLRNRVVNALFVGREKFIPSAKVERQGIWQSIMITLPAKFVAFFASTAILLWNALNLMEMDGLKEPSSI